MTFTTFLFGNGLGRSIDNDYFRIEKGLAHGWDSTWQLTEEDKQTILECLPGDPTKVDIEEGHLEILHEIAQSCDSICREIDNVSLILTQSGQRLSSSVHRLVTQVGWYFHDFHMSDDSVFLEFVDRLVAFMKDRAVHIATLNYDNLLYSKLIEAEVLKGYSGQLIDGFTRDGGSNLTFNDGNLNRLREMLGYYLHLHGSPLFISDGGNVIKQEQGVRRVGREPHMVLHHLNQKRGVISRSYLLNSYWKRFNQSLMQSHSLVIFGYGGFDLHLNELIAARKKDASFGAFKIYVVERSASGTEQERQFFWSSQLGVKDVTMRRLENVLQFDFHELL